MRFKFWARLREQQPDLSIPDEANERATAGLERAVALFQTAQQVKHRSVRTREINHWSVMLRESLAQDRPGRQP